MCQQARRNAVFTLVAGLVLLIFGMLTQPVYQKDEEFYNKTVDAFFMMLRIGGGVFVVVAAISFAGLRVGLLLDAAASAICGVIMGVCGLYWIVKTGISLNDVLFLLFGVLFVRAASISSRAYKASAVGAAGGATAAAGADCALLSEEPQHPASVHPESLPGEGDPAPPEGYLAAMSKEKGKPPDASFK